MKRRDVLKSGFFAAAGLAVPRAARAKLAADEGGEVRVALIGVGTRGRELIRAALLADNLRFVAVCDIWEYARRYGQYYLKSYGYDVNSYADYREMLEAESELDAVFIASPDRAHAEQTAACLKAGRHVYCETPMSNTLDGAREMVAAMQATGKLLQIGYQRRSNPRYRHAFQKLLQQARLTGRMVQVNTSWILALQPDRGWPRRQEIPPDVLKEYGYESMQEFRNWRWYRAHSGGLFPNLGAHQVDVACWFLGARPRFVMATGGGASVAEDRWHADVTAVYEYPTAAGVVPACCQVLTGTQADGRGSYEDFMGAEGTLRISQNPEQTAVWRDPDAPDWDPWVQRELLGRGEEQRARKAERNQSEVTESREVVPYRIPVVLDKPSSYPHLMNFIAAVRGQASLTCPADTALITEVATHRVTTAIREGRKLEFEERDFNV
jgi:predicted dehydrogenase